MSGLFGRFVEGEGVAYLETAQLSGFGFPSLKHAPVLPCWPAGLKTAEKCAVFLALLLKGKELHVLKPLNFERFRISFL